MRTCRYGVRDGDPQYGEPVLHIFAEQQFAVHPGRSRQDQRVPNLKPVIGRQVESLLEADLIHRGDLISVDMAPHDRSRVAPFESGFQKDVEQLPDRLGGDDEFVSLVEVTNDAPRPVDLLGAAVVRFTPAR